jgi:hypothetical protein
LVAVAAATGLMEIVTVPLISWLQVVLLLVANTLKVVALVKLPVGRVIVPPVPFTALPTLALFALFLSW